MGNMNILVILMTTCVIPIILSTILLSDSNQVLKYIEFVCCLCILEKY